MQDLTLVSPMRYFLVIVRGVILESAGVATLVSENSSMAVIGAVNLVAAFWLFCRRTM